MLRFTLAVFFLCLALSSSVFTQTNQTDLLKTLLDLPAPAPFDRDVANDSESKFDKYITNFSKTPPDNAPIEVIMIYWGRYEYVRQDKPIKKPTDIVSERIFSEIETKPDLITTYINILPPKKEYIEFAKSYYDEKSAEINNRVEVDYEKLYESRKSVSEAIAAAEEFSRIAKSGQTAVTSYQVERIKSWLTQNSKYFSDELLKQAGKLKERDNYVSDSESLISLAKVDWEKAEPVVKRLFEDKSKPAMSTVAVWAYYAHFMHEDEEREAAKYRRILQDTVENKKAADGVRDLALDALVMEKDFDGRDDWYISLLEDETLFTLGSYTGLKTIFNFDSAEKWIPKMLDLVGHQNPNVHKAAVRNLSVLLGKTDDKNDKLILQALIPWLANPKWANTVDGRRTVISAYGRILIPESVPGLILIVQNEKFAEMDEDEPARRAMKDAGDKMKDAGDKMKDAGRDAMDKAGDRMKDTIKIERLSENQNAAITALAKYKDSRSIPVLKSALEETTNSYQRSQIIAAIIESDGFDLVQQLNAFEAIARKVVTSDEINSINQIYYSSLGSDLTADESIGFILISTGSSNDELIRLVIERHKVLKKTDPKVADVFSQVLRKWESKVIDTERLTSISNNTADAGEILKALTDRKRLRTLYPNQIFSMLGKRGVAGGIAACILEDQSELLNVINSGDINTKIAGYACARLMRLPIPVDVAGSLLNNSNSLLAKAAERYLIAEDSRKARNMVLAKYPNEAKILGSTDAFLPKSKVDVDRTLVSQLFTSLYAPYYFEINHSAIEKTQDTLREEIKVNQELLGIYAFLKNDSNGHKILRIYKDKAIYSWYEDDARFRERIVTKEELKLIFDYVTDHEIELLTPIYGSCHHGCPSKEFVMFGRNGGRRVFIYAGLIYKQPLYGLEMIFNSLEQGESKLRYHLQEKIAGLEIILDEKKIKAESLWKNGDDFRILVLDKKRQEEIAEEIGKQAESARSSLDYDDFEDNLDEFYRRSDEIDTEIERQRIERKNEPYSWRNVVGNKLGEKVPQPSEDYTINIDGKFPDVATLENPESNFKHRTSAFEVRVGDYETDGVWKVFPNGLTAQVLKADYHNNFVVSTDGKWAIALKTGGAYYLNDLYRINLQTGKEYKIDLPNSINLNPIIYIKAQNKFLIYSSDVSYLKDSPRHIVKALEKRIGKENLKKIKSGYFLIDPETGALTRVKGEFAPFKQITSRNLQSTSTPGIFWVAIPNTEEKHTKIGRYNIKTFKFTEVMRIPQIKLTSMEIWIDEKDAKIYFIYEGHLLSLPLKPSKQPKK